MSFLFQPWKILLAALSEHVRREQERAIEYLQLENQILREKLGGNRVLLSDDQRRRLAVKGKALGRRQLQKIAAVGQADTILRWHRELVGLNRHTESKQNVGRPGVHLPTRKSWNSFCAWPARTSVGATNGLKARCTISDIPSAQALWRIF